MDQFPFYYDEYEDEDLYINQPSADYEDEANRMHPEAMDYISMWNQCVVPIVFQIGLHLVNMIVINAFYRVLIQIAPLKDVIRHVASALLGYISTYHFFDQGNLLIVWFGIFSYTILLLLQWLKVRRKGFVNCACTIVLLIAFELFERDAKIWHQLRGTALIMAMKVISLGFDIQTTKVPFLPSIMEFSGYIFCPANCVLGPWCSYSDYKKSFIYKPILSLQFLKNISINLLMTFVYAVISSCVLSYLIPDNAGLLLTSYRDAGSFRTSHYFISAMSQIMMVVAGFEASGNLASSLFGYQVSRPVDIEIPRSLVSIVVSWNLPMHLWLKQYVFHNVKPFGTFTAILVTYLVSALLHGLNFQLAAVLLSLGFFTFTEFKIRSTLSDVLDACILAQPCRQTPHGVCARKHKHSSTKWSVRALNLFFGALTVLNLAYLGVMFEASFTEQQKGFSISHGIKKWADLKFFGHLLMLVFYGAYLVIR